MRTNSRGKQIDNLNNVAGSDVLAGYEPATRDENSGATSYYGFVDSDGNWYIMREVPTGSVTEDDFIRGTTNFATNWTGRAGLSYQKFNLVF